MDIRRIGAIKEGDVVTGNRTKVKVVKNKVAPPFKMVEFDIIYGEGISYEGDVLDIGSNLEIVKKSGTWYSFGDVRLGQGKEAARRFLKENTDVTEKIASKVRDHYDLNLAGPESKADVAEKQAENDAVPPSPPAGDRVKKRQGTARVSKQ